MPKRVLDVGNCGPDHAAIRDYLTRNFDVEIVQVDDAAGATAQLHANSFDLVLVNRKLDIDYSDGIESSATSRPNPETAHVPVMLVTNYPEHQEAALEPARSVASASSSSASPRTRDRLAGRNSGVAVLPLPPSRARSLCDRVRDIWLQLPQRQDGG